MTLTLVRALSPNLTKYCPIVNPPNQAAVICGVKNGNNKNPGPGHKPPNPHPIPNKAPPAINLKSIIWL